MKTRVQQILLAVSMLFAYTTIAQNIITVDNNPGSTTTHQTLLAAVNAAVDGDIIYLQPSETSYGSATNITKSLTIVGRSHSEPNKVSKIGSITVRASNVTLKGLDMAIFRIEGTTQITENVNIFECQINAAIIGEDGMSDAKNIVVQGSILGRTVIGVNTENVLIANNIIARVGTMLDVAQAGTTIVTNNVFRGQTNSPDTSSIINNDAVPLVLSNNMFYIGSANANQVFEFDTGDFILNNNLSYKIGSTIQFNAINGGSITQNNTLANTNPLFTSIVSSTVASFGGGSTYNPSARLADDFTLQASSPALTGGVNGSQIGVYGNNFLYKQLGQPRGIPTLDVISNDVTVQQNGNLNITINAKAN